jgi:glycosyltransferase involved in cell wall biosynthesis
MVKELQAHGFSGEVIPWTRGVDRNFFYPRTYRQNEQLTLVCVARVSKEKNLEDFFELDYPGAHKIMVGDGPMLDKYKKQYPDVEFVGFKTGHDLAYYYNLADVFVFPSRWETFGIVMIEAMACGTPVAAYPCQGPEDVIDQAETGFMNESLSDAVTACLQLKRDRVYQGSQRWTWDRAWEIFRDNLVELKPATK